MAVQQHNQQQVAARHNGNDQHQSSSSGSEGTEYSDPEDADLDEYPVDRVTGDRLTSQQAAKMNKAAAEMKKPPDGRNLPYMLGDSYPSTTSGRPSDVDVNENRSNHSQASQTPTMTALPARESSHRQQLGTGSAPRHVQPHQTVQASHVDQQRGASGLLVRPDVLDKASSEQTSAGFAFTRPPAQVKTANQKQSVQPNPHTRQQSAPDTVRSNAAASTNTAQRASVPMNSETATNTSMKKRRADPTRDGQVLVQQPYGSTHGQSGHQPTQMQQPVVKTAPECEQFSDDEADVENDIAPQTQTQSQEEGSEELLDYEAPELFDMDYKELKAQSFDLDPNIGEFKLPADQQDDVLPTKLSTISVLQPQDQYSFFKGLSLDDWEHAGDWFLDRFGEIVGRLKENRQEKRKAARLFENEVESRHKAVGKKRKQIEDSLGEMKESGGKVLQGTPKKAKSK